MIIAVAVSLSSGSHGGSGGAGAASTGSAAPSAAGGTASAASPNLACGKPATASSTASAANPSSNATDCGSTTGWISGTAASGSAQWLQVDLGATDAIDHVVVVWGADYARKFKIRTSADGSSWHSVDKSTDVTAGTQTVALPSGTDTQWIQLYLEESSNRTAPAYGGVRFEVYALPDTSASSAAPTTATASSAGSSSAQWTGQFAGYGTAAWKTQWGFTTTGQFGLANLS